MALLGKVGDDWAEGACEAAEAEDNEAVENQVETAMVLEHNNCKLIGTE